MAELSVYPSDRPFAGLVLAHGAGAGQRSHFMVLAAKQLSARGVTTATFDFPYVIARRKVPDKAPVLEESWRAALAAAQKDPAFAGLPLVIGGKSMGGRISSHIAAQPFDPSTSSGSPRAVSRGDTLGVVPSGVDAQHVAGIRGLVFFGYPLHPPGRPDQRRDAHLPDVREPMLFVQGTRDPFGTAGDIRAMLPTLSAGTAVHEVVDGDHSFKVRVSVAGRSQDAVFAEIFDEAAAFIRRLS